MTRLLWTLCFLTVMSTAFYRFVHKGNNILGIWFNHGLWVSSETTGIEFTTYPDFDVLSNDWEKSNCTMRMGDFQQLLVGLQWCDWCYGIGDHISTPDSLRNTYPLCEEFKSPIGDFLIIRADEIDDRYVSVYMYTDWN